MPGGDGTLFEDSGMRKEKQTASGERDSRNINPEFLRSLMSHGLSADEIKKIIAEIQSRRRAGDGDGRRKGLS